jgi:hypothetical protein
VRTKKHSSGQKLSSSRPIFTFNSFSTGAWDYDRLGKLVFNKKFKDIRSGSVIFGKSALVIYLKASVHQEYDWHGRIDIPYAILEHTIPSVDNGRRGSITFTLKSPPKIYEIKATEDLHLYSEIQSDTINVMLSVLANLNLGSPH